MASYHFSVKCGNHNGRKTSATNHLNYINRDGKFKNIDKNNNEKQINECVYKENFLPAWAEGSAKNFVKNFYKKLRRTHAVSKETPKCAYFLKRSRQE